MAQRPKNKTTRKTPKTPGMKNTITVRMVRGKISCLPRQRATLTGLGLKNRHQEKTLENTPPVRGMIKKVLHLVEIVSEN